MTARTCTLTLALCVAMGLNPALRAEEPAVGKPAPGFSLTDTAGKTHALADYKGKYVVLEWINHDCPFVKKHYGTGNMQKLQKTYADKGVTWLSICSSAAGKQGNYPAGKWNEMNKEKNVAAAAVLLDPDGKVGKLYGAKTTPHCFVINPDGAVIYMGGIDDKATFDPEDVKTARNYVAAALDAAMEGKPVETTTAQPYGCSVKY